MGEFSGQILRLHLARQAGQISVTMTRFIVVRTLATGERGRAFWTHDEARPLRWFATFSPRLCRWVSAVWFVLAAMQRKWPAS